MIRVGILVRIIYPDYAKGMQGRVQAMETAGRWLVQIEEESSPNPEYDKAPMMLSLEESDFEEIDER